MAIGSMDWHGELTRLIPVLRRYALSLTRSPDQADDLLQSTLERALAKRHLFEPGSNLEGWLFRICRNIRIDELRRRKHQGDPVDPEVVEMTLAVDGMREISEKVMVNQVSVALNTLSEDQRSVLLCVGVEGHSYQEASDILDIPIGTVMSRLARARKALSAALEAAPADASRRRTEQ